MSNPTLFPGEAEAIRTALAIGAQHGYGNVIAHLQTAWARVLMDRYAMTEQQARAASGPGYPFEWQKEVLAGGAK